ncbi:hypothetical protein MW887_008153 [Aspergillus wentii]|nr:hypothetical protein MW887_008153 [Aspergillus wentii]
MSLLSTILPWHIVSRILSSLRRKPTIFKLPHELRVQIFNSLSLTSQACFALTRKAFYEEFSWVLKDEELGFPKVFLDEARYTRSNHLTSARRDLLVHRLQTKHWLYCSSCLKVHPPREFVFKQRMLQPEDRACRYPGVVILCDCLHLTLRGKRQVFGMLKRMRYASRVTWHECTVTNHPWANVDIEVSFGLSEDQYLLAFVEYIVRPHDIGKALCGRSINCCPHRDILDFLYTHDKRFDCPDCPTSMEVTHARSRFILRVVRNLGMENVRPPSDYAWEDQRQWVFPHAYNCFYQ